MTAVATPLRPRHWTLALGAALLLHGGLLVAFHDLFDGGTVALGIGGIHVGLPPAGAAPGAPAESAEAEAVAPAEAAAVPPAPVEEVRRAPEVETAAEAPPPEAVPLYAPVETAEAVEPPEEETATEALPPVEPEVVETEQVPVEEVVAETPMAVPPPPKAKPQQPIAETPVAEAPAPEAELGETQSAAIEPQEGPPATADEIVGNAGKAGSGDRAATGAAVGQSGGGAPGAFVDYDAQLLAWLEKHKEYPRRARLRRQEGIALLQFVMDRSGKVLEYRILESSGYKLLDDEVVAMIERASPLPKPPAAMAGERFEYQVPIWFNQR